MPTATEVKKLDPNWERKAADVPKMNLGGDLEWIDREILRCNEAVTDAGLGGISYCASQKSEIQNQVNAIETMEKYVMDIRSALQQQLDDPLFDGFNKKATETLSRIHPEKFQTANTIGLKYSCTNLYAYNKNSSSFEKEKDYLDLCDFLGYNAENNYCNGGEYLEKSEFVQDFADMFKADYDAAYKFEMLKDSNVKSLDDYLKSLLNRGEFSHQMDQPFKTFLSGLLDFTIVKPIIDACRGSDCITGEDLSGVDRSMDLLFAGISSIALAGVAGKAIKIGGKEGALFLGKSVAVDGVSYTAAYSAGQLAEQAGLPPQINILLSLGIGIVATKVAGKYILKNAKGAVIGEIHENPTGGAGENPKTKLIPPTKKIREKLDSEGLTQDRIDQIVSLPKSQKPKPETYLSNEYIKEHLQSFKDSGVVKIMPSEPTGTIGGKGGTFVMSHDQLNGIIESSKGDVTKIEDSLGFDRGYLGKNPVIVEIHKYSDLRLPQGNELGASPEYWIPGGYTIGGIKEAVIAPAPIGAYTFKHLF